MTDPSNALRSFQQLFLTGKIQLEPGRLDTNLCSYVDEMDGTTRFTLIRLEGKTVTAFVVFARDGTIEGKACFAIGYAVPEAYRNQGCAKRIVRAALAEMQGAFRRLYLEFYVVAIVGADIKSSQCVAEQTISNTPVAVTDKISGLPALQYVRKDSNYHGQLIGFVKLGQYPIRELGNRANCTYWLDEIRSFGEKGKILWLQINIRNTKH